MAWESYLGILRHRWWIVVIVVLLDVVVSGYLFARTARHAGYQSCSTLYVADASSPSLILAPPTTLQNQGQLLEGETAANFFADDVLDVAQSQHVALYVASSVRSLHLPNTALSDINGAVGGSRRDRTIQLCAANPHASSALAVNTALDRAMTSARARFLGPLIKQRTYVSVISDPSSSPVAAAHAALNLAPRLILGLFLSLALAFLWDAVDPTVRDRDDASRVLGVPTLLWPR
ncbi:MAG: hypothetical protein ACR2GA_02315 [Chloroflexota bacterium]